MRVAPAVLALLVVLAGCSAFDVAPDPAPATPTASPTPGPGTTTARPIGLSAAGVTDPWQLREAHARALEDRSYTYEYELTVGWGGTTRGRAEVTYRVTADRSRLLLERRVSGDVAGLMPSSDVRRYDAGTTSVVRYLETGATEVRQSSPGASLSERYVPDRDFVYQLLSSVDTEVVGTESRGDRTLFVVAGTAATTSVARGRVRNVSVRAVVAPSGLVTAFRTAYDLDREADGADARRTLRVEHRIRYRAVGETTVERPSWATAAVGTATRGNRTGGGHVDDVPAGQGTGRPAGVPPPVDPSRPGPPPVVHVTPGPE